MVFKKIMKFIGYILPISHHLIKLDNKEKEAKKKVDEVIESIDRKKCQKHSTDKLRQVVLMKVANAK